jgi:hypothetical protein
MGPRIQMYYFLQTTPTHVMYLQIRLHSKICSSHGGHYEECRLLGYKNPARTSQETNYVSAIELSKSMLCKNWGLRGGDYDECRLLGHKNPVRTSQETHYVSATEPNRSVLCKICGFHGGDYEECRLLGHKKPDRTSQETHHFSATESSQLMLCKIWGFHGGDYEEWRFQDCIIIFPNKVKVEHLEAVKDVYFFSKMVSPIFINI